MGLHFNCASVSSQYQLFGILGYQRVAMASVEILDFPHPKPLPHKEGGALTAHYGSESSPSLILGVRGRGMGVFFNRVAMVAHYQEV